MINLTKLVVRKILVHISFFAYILLHCFALTLKLLKLFVFVFTKKTQISIKLCCVFQEVVALIFVTL